MKRLVPMIVAIVAGLAFAAAVPVTAVAGIHAVPVASAVPASADSCADETPEAQSFIIVSCEKKAQSGKVTLCQPVQALVPAAQHDAVAANAGEPGFGASLRRPDVKPQRLHRPPRG